MKRQRIRGCGVVAALLFLGTAAPAAAQYREAGWTAASPRPQLAGDAGQLAWTLPADADTAGGRRWSPGWVRFTGGFVGATASLAGLMAATWNDPDAVADPVIFGAFALATWLGTATVTSVWEKPNVGILAGAAIGALPLLVALGTDDDDSAGGAMLVAWISAPLGAAVGQRMRSPRPRK